MSIINCESCDAPINSDDDPGCFCEPPEGMCTEAQRRMLTTVLCELCRESEWERQQEAISAEPPPTLQEQQQRAWAQKHGLKQ